MTQKLRVLTFLMVPLFMTAQQQVTISMGAGYGDDVFYSLPGGIVKTESGRNWDIALTTEPVDASILINDSRGIMLYLASNDVNDWATLDTTGMMQNPLYNSSESWELGAFANMGTSFPDYGWGEYNQITHNVNGTRIFVLELSDGSFKKIIIESMEAMSQLFTFRYADLDGSNEVTKTVNKSNYTDRNFIYYDFATDQFIDREPNKTEWDLVARRYDLEIPAGPMTFHYIVTGVQTNKGLSSAEVRGAVVSAADSANYARSSADISTIGSDWKSFDNATFTWSIEDSLSYFVNSNSGGVYHLTFTDFGGSGTGDIIFDQSPAQSIGLNDIERPTLTAFPNPTLDKVTIDLAEITSDATIRLTDLNGRVIFEDQTSQLDQEYVLEMSSFNSGVYILALTGEGLNYTTRIVLNR